MQWTLVAFFLAATGATRAQSTPATAEQGIRLQVFGLASYVRPDLGGALKNAGGAIGADANLKAFGFHNLQPGIEIRYAASGGRVSNQYVFSGGPRILYDFGRFEPYADLLVGKGNAVFNHPDPVTFTHDDSIVFTYGGGLDYSFTRAWAVRGDIQRQRWRFDEGAPAFHPLAISAGLRYQFHFHNQYGPE